MPFGSVDLPAPSQTPRSHKEKFFWSVFLIFGVFSSHNSPPKLSKKLEIRYVYSVGTLDVRFGCLDFLVPLNPSYSYCGLGKKHRKIKALISSLN